MFRLGSSHKIKLLAKFLGLHIKQVASADLVCGYTCPFARDCKSYANKKTGKIHDAPDAKFRCYGATLEGAFPSVRKLHWNNFDLVRDAKTTGKITDILLAGMVDIVKILRIHSFGDFFIPEYFQAWINVAEKMPHVNFFAYTKGLHYLAIPRPDNFLLTYSFGGTLDHLLTTEPTAYVVRSSQDAEKIGVPLACKNHPADDYDFIRSGKSFAILLHGTQPKGGRIVTS